MKSKTEAKVEMIKKIYPVGTKIELDYMDDPQPIPSGSVCTVRYIDSIGQIHVDEYSLAIVPDVDRFHKI